MEVDEKVKNHVFSDASGQAGKLYEQQPMIITGSSSNTMSLLDYPIHHINSSTTTTQLIIVCNVWNLILILKVVNTFCRF